jgi:hypothetical protein
LAVVRSAPPLLPLLLAAAELREGHTGCAQLKELLLGQCSDVEGEPVEFAQGEDIPSLLIASGADVKVVQARLRHASAETTLDTYGHLWPDADESARGAVGVVLAARADYLRTREGG